MDSADHTKTIVSDSGPAANTGPTPAGAASTAVESIANVRRDGNQNIIEVDLRDNSLGEDDLSTVVKALPMLPKLRSVLLSEARVTDALMESVGKISGLENLDLRGCSVGDEGLAHLAGLTRLKSIKLSGKSGSTTVTDAGVASLGGVDSLQVVAIDFLPISDVGVAALGDLKQMKELYMAGTMVTDQVADTLVGFPELTKLRIASTDFSTQGLSELKPLSRLVELDVSDCAAIDDQALEAIAGFKQLAKLNVYNTMIGDADWNQLAGLDKLTWLNVDKTSVDDQSLEGIGALNGLTFLHLGSTQVTDAGMEQLVGLSNLEKLIVTRTAVTAAGVQELKAALPETEIQLEYVEGK